MDPVALADAHEPLWYYLVTPLLVLTALVLTVRLRAPQWRRLPDAIRALRGPSEGITPLPAFGLSTVGTFGAASAIGAFTAVSLGGAGALPWLWLFGFLLAPIPYAEIWLARTDAPGRAGSDDDATGSLARRLYRMGERWRLLGALLALLVIFAAFTFGGAANADALARATSTILPGSTLALVGAAAGVGALLALGGSRTHAIAGWLGLVGLGTLLAAGLWALFSDPGGCFGALASSFTDAFEGAAQRDAWTGALAGEIARSTTTALFVPLAAPTGASGAVHALSAHKTRDQAALSLLGSLTAVVIATLLVMVGVGTGALGQRVQSRRAILDDVRIHRLAAESASQRAEEERLYTGMERIADGASRNPSISVATARGMIHEPRFVQVENGETKPADLALRVVRGRPDRVMLPGRFGALQEAPLSVLEDVYVEGEMVPDGPELASASLERAHDFAPRLALAALLALAAVGFAVWGTSAARALSSRLPPALALGVSILPAAGAGLAISGVAPWLAPLGALAAGALVALAALVILARSREIATLDR
ncbi:MAG: alanine:cation symporter family protein [Myxococcota bacterium]|jgi:AGCS family alanine or glycine:cation symporter|nr:alanine:cation symporter family protein [Myxococcota bacterium]